jgi:hypothetical protein
LPDNNWHEILKPLLNSDLVSFTLFNESDHIGIDGDGLDNGIGRRRVLNCDRQKTLTWIWNVSMTRKSGRISHNKNDPFMKEMSTGESMLCWFSSSADNCINSSVCQTLLSPSPSSSLAEGMPLPGQRNSSS